MFLLVFIASCLVVNGVDAKVDENTIYVIKNLDKYEKTIYDMKMVVDNLKKETVEQKKYINDYENNQYLDDIISMNEEIENLKLYNGFTDVRGPGIYLTVSDNLTEDENIDIMKRLIHDVDITVLLNDLKAAGAEAITVNNKRIINISEVVCAGPLLGINGDKVPAPFLISAVGDMEALHDAVTEEGTYAYELKNTYGMEVVARMSYNVTVPKFHGNNYQINFATSIER